MLDIKLITENPELVKARLAKKGYEVDFTEILEIDAEKKKLMAHSSKLIAQGSKFFVLRSTSVSAIQTKLLQRHG